MATLNARSFSSAKNINLKGQGSTRGGILRFEGTNSTNPLSSTSNGLYVNASNELIFAHQGTATTLGASGSSALSLNGAYGQGSTITMDSGAIVFNDSTAGAANVLTINKSGAGSGDVIEVVI